MTASRKQNLLLLIPLMIVATAFTTPATAQDHGGNEHSKHGTQAASSNADIVKELAALRAQIAQLEASLQLGHRAASPDSDATAEHTTEKHSAMGRMGGKGQMGMSGMGAMGAKPMGGMRGMRSMMGMGPKAKDVDGATDEMEVRSDLPGDRKSVV